MNIRELRKQYGLTQQALSDRFGIPKRTIENWEGGQNTPPDYIPKMIEEILAFDALKKVKGVKK